MKYDELGCLIREFHPEGHWANYGDSCAETSRADILGDISYKRLMAFQNLDGPGFIRHPVLKDVHGWDEADFSGDQFVALCEAIMLKNKKWVYINGMSMTEWKVPGTKTWLTPAAWFLIRGHWRLLNIANIAQGLLLKAPWRIGDGGKVESIDGQVQDYLNMICTFVFLKKLGHWATLPLTRERCLAAVKTYYLEGEGAEPNSQWIVDLYEKALA